MEFYRGETKDKINYSEYVELEDELQDFLYGNRHLLDSNAKYIYEIDPYGDTEFYAEQISSIISICRSIKVNGVLDNYDKGENAKEVFESLEKLFVKALKYNQKIFAIGD